MSDVEFLKQDNLYVYVGDMRSKFSIDLEISIVFVFTAFPRNGQVWSSVSGLRLISGFYSHITWRKATISWFRRRKDSIPSKELFTGSNPNRSTFISIPPSKPSGRGTTSSSSSIGRPYVASIRHCSRRSPNPNGFSSLI